MSEQRLAKQFEELKFSDDFMFGKVMEDKELCREVLECLLQRPVGELQEVQTQKEIQYYEDGKPIRLDVYNRDRIGIIYDAEMQNLNKRTVKYHQLPKRSRFYQSMIDTDILGKGNSYKMLPDSNVLFICTFDPFQRGLFKYTFINRCKEDRDIALNDGTTKIFFNCVYKGNDIPQNLRKLYDYIETGTVYDRLTNRINDAIDNARKNHEWRSVYVKERLSLQDAKDDRDFEKIEEMLRDGRTVEQIVDFCHYDYEQVKLVEEALLTPTN